MPYSYCDGQAGDQETRRFLERETARAVGQNPQAARVCAFSPYASRKRWSVVPDVPWRCPEHEAGLTGEIAEHGVVHQLSHWALKSSAQGALRLRDLSLLMASMHKAEAA